jgi:hypothetical protein
MEDFYHVAPLAQRPQILALTASPEGVEGSEGLTGSKKKKKKGRGAGGNGVGALATDQGGQEKGLQWRLNARLITVADELR